MLRPASKRQSRYSVASRTPAAANPSRRMRQLSYLPQARPPLNVSAAEIDEARAILERAMAAVA